MDGSRLQADVQFVLQRSMHCAMLIPSVMTAVPGGDAVQSSPDLIAEDQRKGLVFKEGDDCAVSTMHSQNLARMLDASLRVVCRRRCYKQE